MSTTQQASSSRTRAISAPGRNSSDPFDRIQPAQATPSRASEPSDRARPTASASSGASSSSSATRNKSSSVFVNVSATGEVLPFRMNVIVTTTCSHGDKDNNMATHALAQDIVLIGLVVTVVYAVWWLFYSDPTKYGSRV